MYKRLIIQGVFEVNYTDQDIYLDSFLKALKLIEKNLISYNYGCFLTKEFSDNTFTLSKIDYKNAVIKTSPILGAVLRLQYVKPNDDGVTQLRISLFL